MNVTLIRENKLILRQCLPLFSLEVGMVLIGSEIPCFRKRLINCSGAFVKIINGCITMHNLLFNCICHKERTISLLVHLRELTKIKRYINSKGNSCFVENVHFKHNLIKSKITIGKGKKKYNIAKGRRHGGELEVDSVSL